MIPAYAFTRVHCNRKTTVSGNNEINTHIVRKETKEDDEKEGTLSHYQNNFAFERHEMLILISLYLIQSSIQNVSKKISSMKWAFIMLKQ